MAETDNKLINGAGLGHLASKIKDDLNTKQDTLISGTNIKTINNSSILDSGNIDLSLVTIKDWTTEE